MLRLHPLPPVQSFIMNSEKYTVKKVSFEQGHLKQLPLDYKR